MVQDESEIYPCRSELGALSRRPTRAEPRRPPLFLGTARPPNACVPARIDRWRSCRPTFAGGTPASEGRAVPRRPTPGSGAVPKTPTAPVRPNPVRPRESVPQRETTLVGAASVGTAPSARPAGGFAAVAVRTRTIPPVFDPPATSPASTLSTGPTCSSRPAPGLRCRAAGSHPGSLRRMPGAGRCGVAGAAIPAGPGGCGGPVRAPAGPPALTVR